MIDLASLNLFLATGGLLLAFATIALYADYFLNRGRQFGAVLEGKGLSIAAAVALASVVLSLVYSEYFGFIPCSLCWLQRIAIYPQALMALLAIRFEDRKFFPVYGIGLSLFGLAVSIYQYVYQLLPKETLSTGVMPCLIDGSGADCAVKVIDEFGFVTFPFLSGVTFAFLVVIYLYIRKG